MKPKFSMHLHDRDRLQHMLESCESVVRMLAGISREDFGKSELHLNAVVRQIEVIGEAASKVTEDFRRRSPEIAWPVIIGMRHRLAHAYYSIDIQTV